MARVLLINPSYEASYRRVRAGIVNPIYPVLGLAAIAGEALRRGHDVRIRDMSYEPYDWRPLRALIRSWAPDVVGLTGATPLMNQIRDISLLCKDISPSLTVVAGGPHVSAMPEASIRESMLDAVFAGESDDSFGELCDGAALKDIKGVWYRDGDAVRFTGNRPLIADLDTLAMPAWHLYDPAVYRDRISRILVRTPPVTSAEFSRGCVFKCDYCASKNTMGLGYRKKSPERCAEEVQLMHRLGWNEFALTDDIFTSDTKWAKEVCRAVSKAGAPMLWTCTNGIRVESADDDLFETMRAAGCYRVSFGFESGSDEVLKAFGKGGRASIEQGRVASKAARKAGIETNGYFMVGLTGDNEESLEDTIDFARSMDLDMISFGITVPFPGTPMFQSAAREGRVRSWNWDDYNAYNEAELFTHPTLTRQQVLNAMSRAYQQTIMRNPAFLIRRLQRGFKRRDIHWDAYYFLKFIRLPAFQAGDDSVDWYGRDRWPVHDFLAGDGPEVHAVPVAKATKRAKRVSAS